MCLQYFMVGTQIRNSLSSSECQFAQWQIERFWDFFEMFINDYVYISINFCFEAECSNLYHIFTINNKKH